MLVELIASRLGLPPRYVRGLANSASHHYKTYSIPRRAGGLRTIHHPSKPLKAIQRLLLRDIVAILPVHPSSMAYQRGSRTTTNAATHANSRYLLRMDFADFFPSLTDADILLYIEGNPIWFQGWTPTDTMVFCDLVCRNEALPIGAPTSPMLSNALCFELDERLSGLAVRNAATYTRYADDLFFSTHTPNILSRFESDVPNVLASLSYPTGLRINPTKTRHSSKKGARRVTGITLGSDGHIHLGRHNKRRIRSMLFRYDALLPEEKGSLRGWIAYSAGIDPDFMNSLIAKYGLERIRQAQEG